MRWLWRRMIRQSGDRARSQFGRLDASFHRSAVCLCLPSLLDRDLRRLDDAGPTFHVAREELVSFTHAAADARHAVGEKKLLHVRALEHAVDLRVPLLDDAGIDRTRCENG